VFNQLNFQQYFSYIVEVSFIEGGNRRTRRKPPTYRKSLTNCIAQCCIEYTSQNNGVRTHNFCGDRHWLHR